jgi:hypothetical protein
MAANASSLSPLSVGSVLKQDGPLLISPHFDDDLHAALTSCASSKLLAVDPAVALSRITLGMTLIPDEDAQYHGHQKDQHSWHSLQLLP